MKPPIDQTRRHFLAKLAFFAGAATLGGCGASPRPGPLPDGQFWVDIHAHIFNGRDVPVVGFVEQTIFRDPHQDVNPDELTGAFLKLLARILLSGTPTAERELALIRLRGLPRRSQERVLAEDQTNVARALEATTLEARSGVQGRLANEDLALLSRLSAELQLERPRTLAPETAREQARGLAARIYERATGGRSGEASSFRFISPIIQTIRWAGLLTRSRSDILAELLSLYGSQVSVFSPSLVDFGSWFKTQEPDVSPIRTQIDLFSEIARRTDDRLILNFAPFCPLRSALERDADPEADTLANVRYAVLERGFVGVKLYPPMGFRPIGNTADVSEWAPRAPKGGGAALDHELLLLYRWCVQNDVPIKTHANNSVAAGANTGQFADPDGWDRVLRLEGLGDMRLNLAHFGGFEESLHGGVDWEEKMVRFALAHPNLYFDLGYWTEATGLDHGDATRVIVRASRLIERRPEIATRMMYGSDWSMIGRVPRHREYIGRMERVLRQLLEDEDSFNNVMGANALRYLGLDEDGPQRARLATFFRNHPIYEGALQAAPA